MESALPPSKECPAKNDNNLLGEDDGFSVGYALGCKVDISGDGVDIKFADGCNGAKVGEGDASYPLGN